MISNGSGSTSENGHRNRLQAHTTPRRAPARPRGCAHPVQRVRFLRPCPLSKQHDKTRLSPYAPKAIDIVYPSVLNIEPVSILDSTSSSPPCRSCGDMATTLIEHGTIVDGTGKSAFAGSVLVDDDRIVDICSRRGDLAGGRQPDRRPGPDRMPRFHRHALACRLGPAAGAPRADS